MIRRYLYLTGGILALILGIAGILLPLLPGTPFLILAAFCFSQSSETFHRWLLEHKYLGPPIRQWESTGAIRPRIKILSIVMMCSSSILVLPNDAIPLWGKLGYGVCLLAGVLFVATRPNR